MKICKKVLTKAIWAEKNGLVSERLACTSGKIKILNKIGIQILILNFQVNYKRFFHPKTLKSENNYQ